MAYNLGQNFCRLFHFLAQFLFTTNETELDYYHQKVIVRVALRASEHFLNDFLELEKSHLLFKLIFKATQSQKIPEYDIFKKTIIQ